jgi:NTP pyrophosphatase (non-canonical NTP hydrolase)
MNSIFQDQAEFMIAGKQLVHTGDVNTTALYANLIQEEIGELSDAYEEGTQAEVIKEALDVIYVIAGLLNTICTDPTEAWDLVHSNNMHKVTGPVIKNEEGKIQKSVESVQRKVDMMRRLSELAI